MRRYVGPIPGRAGYFALEDHFDSGEEHCCSDMNRHISEKEQIILYIARTREYAIRASDCMIQTFTFCPWCDAKLPCSLRDKLFDTIQKEYGLDIGFFELEEDSDLSISPDFKTAVWWKKRGL